MNKLLLRSLLLVGLCSVWALAVKTADPQDVFSRAQRAYSEGNYAQSVAILRSYIKDNGRDSATEYLVPLLLEALVRTNDVDISPKLINIYQRRFTQSPYLPRVFYLSGILSARTEEYVQAIEHFSLAIAGGLSPELDSLALNNVRGLCQKALTAQELNSLAEKNLQPRVMETVRYYRTLKLYESGQVAKAGMAAEEFSRQYDRSPLSSSAKTIEKNARTQQRDRFNIGLLAPLSGYDADIGKSIVQATQLAVDTYNRSHEYKINLVICDTRGNMVETARKTFELVHEHKVAMILGPVLSANAVVAAAAVAGHDVVMLSPTATEEGIAELGSNVFQMNVTLGVLGRRVAEYAMKNLNIREFAIFAPISEYGRYLSESFKKEVLAQGGTIVAEEHFDEAASDFRPQFQSLRNKLIKYRREKAAAEQAVGAGDLKTSFARDSISLKDSELPVGGLFIPAEAEDVVMIAPQVPFHKIRTQLLGATGWHTPKTILDGKQYVENAIIATSFLDDRTSPQWKQFSERYNTQFKTEPDRVAALGYDAAQIVCSILQKLGSTANTQSLSAALHDTRGYRGVSGVVSFDKDKGMNSEATILKIANKTFVRVQ
jgi:ABC-type branched-subunit amino acid transport system substrate-binding protein